MRMSIGSVLHAVNDKASLLRLLMITTALFLIFSLLAPEAFFSVGNFQFLALASPELAILSMAIALTMLTGGIDLSVVGIANTAGVCASLVMVNGSGAPLQVISACALGLLVAAACGLFNGLVVAGLRVTPILATLGTSQLFGGLALVLSGGTAVVGLPGSFTGFANATVAGIPVVLIVMGVIAGAMALLAGRTALGFRMRMYGANPTAATFSGIRSAVVLASTYTLSGALAGVAGLIISARASGANSTYGSSYILLGIVVAVLAGVDPEGGSITIAGVLVATFALQILSTGLVALQMDGYIVNIAQGLLLIGVMALNRYVGHLPPLGGLRVRRIRRGLGTT
jgi:simple sugar transport system permease protein